MKDVVSAGFLLGIGFIYLFYSWQYEAGTADNPGAGLFPRIIGLILTLSSLLLLLRSLRHRTEKNKMGTLWQELSAGKLVSAISVVGSVVLYLIVLNTAGFLLASPFLVFFLARIMGGSHWMANLILGVVSSGVIYWLFWIIMRVPIPPGFWGGR